MGTLVVWRRSLFRKLLPFHKLNKEDQLFWRDTFRLYKSEVSRVRKSMRQFERSIRISSRKQHRKNAPVVTSAFKAHYTRTKQYYEEQKSKLEDLQFYIKS